MHKIGVALLGLIVSTAALAGNSSLPDGPYVVADGSASIQKAPDYVTVYFEVSYTADTTSKAMPFVQDRVAKVFKLVRDQSIPEKDIRASDVDVHAQLGYNDGKQTYEGQTVERSFTVVLHDLGKYSDFMQGLLNADVSEVTLQGFDTKDREGLLKKAMDAAIDDAHSQAEE